MKRRQLCVGDVDEPIAKRTRLQLSTQPLMVRLGILPSGPLHLLFGKLDATARLSLANASVKLKADYDDFMLQEYKCFIHHQRSIVNSDDPMPPIISKVLDDAVGLYVSAGYIPSFVSVLPQLFDDRHEVGSVSKMQNFLYDFYKKLEEDFTPRRPFQNAADKLQLQQLRLNNLITLLTMLRKFRGFRGIKGEKNLMHWQLGIQVGGIYFSERIKTIDNDADKLIDLTRHLAELLVCDMCGTSYNNLFRSVPERYDIGVHQNNPHTCLELKFSILGTESLYDLIDNIIAGQFEISEVKDWTTMAFSIRLNIKSRRDRKAMAKYWQICILPLNPKLK
ncbi:uncharacterized protein LOC132790557 [Drosophila nasuta]|uniref:uncharacterized protein LOC132790557 n=1 Tax=Drosophila nasuta TaxID=42062 RepID=UPI00295F04B1|nr:uncharacterized protein LOC132790557 [Drosophila nasuta]XP_060655110.1 uncharacterized protein LOC132790557 [Drosophila nasuta]